MSTRPAHRRDADEGAALILAIGFVVVVSLISAALVALATSGLNNRRALGTARDREYAADGAIEQSIAQVRSLTCATPSGTTVDTLNNLVMRVDWVTACGVVQGGVRDATGIAANSDGVVVMQRNVIFSACPSTGAGCDPAQVVIRAEINFQQSPPSSATKTYVQSWSVNR